MKITHAYVRYEDDKRSAIVGVSDIEDFCPQDEDDFSATAYYSVKWTASDGTSDFYRARILILGESQQAVSTKASKRRVRFHRIISSDSSDDSMPQKSPKKRKSPPNAAAKEKLLSILEKKKAKIAAAEKSCNEQLPNIQLREALARAEERIGELEGDLKRKNSLLERLQKKSDDQEEELKGLRKANLALQEKLLRSLDIFEGDHSTATRPATSTAGKAACPSLDMAQDSIEMQLATPQRLIEVKTPTDDDAMVDIGQGLLIKKKSWERIQRQEKDSIFVKELMTSIWMKEDLRGRSLQGKHSPLFPDRPRKTPLTPWKVAVMRECYKARLEAQGYPKGAVCIAAKQMNHFVVEKIADVDKVAKRALKFSNGLGEDDGPQ